MSIRMRSSEDLVVGGDGHRPCLSFGPEEPGGAKLSLDGVVPSDCVMNPVAVLHGEAYQWDPLALAWERIDPSRGPKPKIVVDRPPPPEDRHAVVLPEDAIVCDGAPGVRRPDCGHYRGVERSRCDHNKADS